MSRLPPQIEQKIDGVPVEGWSVQPLVLDGITYKVTTPHRYDDKGKIVGEDCFVEATNAKGVSVWKTKYASFDFEPRLETDVQEQFPVDFYINGNELVIKHEHYTENDRVYRIMIEDGAEKLKIPL